MKTLDYFELMKYFDQTAATAKERIWTVTSWILALNSGLIAYSFKIFIEHRTEALRFLPFELILCAVGIVLCAYSLPLIKDH
jgi:hypothetical protein